MVREILAGLDNTPGDPNRTTIFTGARGTGKTVLLATIAEEAASRGWLSANVTAREGLLDEILMQIRDNAANFLEPANLSRTTGVQIAGFGLTRTSDAAPKRTWRSTLTSLVKELNDQDIGLLITVDEIDAKSMALHELVDTYQHLVRERRNVALIMAGLPGRVSRLLRDEKISFLRRAFQQRLTPVPSDEVAFAMRRTIETAGRSIPVDALRLAADSTQGFPFMIQLVGYSIWRQHPDESVISRDDVDQGIQMAELDLRRMIFDSTLQGLSPQDIRFLVALARAGGPQSTAQLATALGKSTNHTSQYRRRLLEQGVIGERAFNQFDFDIPMLREYILEGYVEQ